MFFPQHEVATTMTCFSNAVAGIGGSVSRRLALLLITENLLVLTNSKLFKRQPDPPTFDALFWANETELGCRKRGSIHSESDSGVFTLIEGPTPGDGELHVDSDRNPAWRRRRCCR